MKSINCAKNLRTDFNVAWTVFQEYIDEKNVPFDLKGIRKEDLNELLRKFHVEVRKRDGTHYLKQTFM